MYFEQSFLHFVYMSSFTARTSSLCIAVTVREFSQLWIRRNWR